jgi:hypothetical protein
MLGCSVGSSEPHGAIVQTVLIDKLKKENELRLGGHNMGPAPLLLGAVMKAIIAAIKDYAMKCDHEPDWWTKEGRSLHQAQCLRYI